MMKAYLNYLEKNKLNLKKNCNNNKLKLKKVISNKKIFIIKHFYIYKIKKIIIKFKINYKKI